MKPPDVTLIEFEFPVWDGVVSFTSWVLSAVEFAEDARGGEGKELLDSSRDNDKQEYLRHRSPSMPANT